MEEKKMVNTKERLKELVGKLGMGQNSFEASCGLGNGIINNSRGGVSSSTLEKILITYPNISLDWLVCGKGSMFKDEPIKSYTTGIPYFDVDFEMGFDLMVNDQTTTPEYNIDFAPYNKCTCWCNARGNSMYPTIASGDIIALKEIKDISFLVSDEIYAIVTKNDMRTIKRLRDCGDEYALVPDNKQDYSEQRIKKDMIAKVYQVMGTMKMF